MVGAMSIMSAYDRWLTTEPDYDPEPRPRCDCGRFLPAAPARSTRWDDGIDCDGTVTEVDVEYEASTRLILGLPEGSTFRQSFSACSPDRGPHEPHREVFAEGVIEYRVCRRCGRTTADRR